MTTPGWTPDSEEPPPYTASLGEAIQWLGRRAPEGVDCPACARWTQVYTWSLRDTWVEILKQVAADPDEWVMLAKYAKKKVQNAALLRHWGLIERSAGRREDGYRSTGYYRLTDLGRRFLRGEVSVPRQITTFDGECLGYVDENDRVYVHEVLGYRFDFDSFMRGEG